MQLLVSLCNEVRDGQLCQYDAGTGDVCRVELCHPDIPPHVGATGLAAFEDGFLTALQSEPATLVSFNRQFEVRNVWQLRLTKDAHSIVVRDGAAYIASAATNAVVCFTRHGGEQVYWTADAAEPRFHLNSLAWHQGDLYVTGCRPRRDRLRGAEAGWVMNLRSGRVVLSPLHHPHSLLSAGDGLLLCESRYQAVVGGNGDRLAVGNGYTRGLALTAEHLYVGVSRGRTKSRSTGLPLDNPQQSGVPTGWCGVHCYRRQGPLSQSRLAWSVPLGEDVSEVYDILVLP
jgi:hypothetical protein